ncbi:MAG: hypothetical protein JHC31_08380 [Sulfurihydrogenibium sp.]|jgi:hypothetical protein|nr:hypothetical protein [Sulfurihydrogenibium sp.]
MSHEKNDQYLIEGVSLKGEKIKVATDNLDICLSLKIREGKKYRIRNHAKLLLSEVLCSK